MPTDAAGLEAAVAEQGDKVRQLKASGAEKVRVHTVTIMQQNNSKSYADFWFVLQLIFAHLGKGIS